MINPKKILAVGMLVILAAPLFFWVVYFIKQQHIRHEIIEKLEYASLQTITVTKAEFKWVKKNKEIIINGQLFDVKSFIINKNEVIVTGIFDAEESKLEEVFASVMYQTKSKTAPINTLILKFILTPAFLNTHVTTLPAAFKNTTPMYGFYQEATISKYYSISIPPPIV